MGEMRRRFTKEYKIEAVHLATVGAKSLAQVVRELGLRPDVLRAWKRQYSAAPGPAEAFPGTNTVSPTSPPWGCWRGGAGTRRPTARSCRRSTGSAAA